MLSDKAKELLCAAAKGDGLEIVFSAGNGPAPGERIYSIYVGREYRRPQMGLREWLEYVNAAGELVDNKLGTSLPTGGVHEYVVRPTVEGFKEADSICE